MAKDWIKMRTDLYRDPKICMIADFLMSPASELSIYVNQQNQCDMSVTRNVMRNVTVGALVSVWGVLRHSGKRVGDDLSLRNCTLSVLDDVADIAGFGEAMESVGWAIASDEGVVLPMFFNEFNIDPNEDAKAKNAERQRKFREKNNVISNDDGNVTVTLKSNAREEKRREEITTPKSSIEFDEFWSAYPNKTGKAKAQDSWKKLKPILADVLNALAWQVKSEQWTKDNGQYIPNPATYLNQGRWNDESKSAVASNKPFSMDEFLKAHS